MSIPCWKQYLCCCCYDDITPRALTSTPVSSLRPSTPAYNVPQFKLDARVQAAANASILREAINNPTIPPGATIAPSTERGDKTTRKHHKHASTEIVSVLGMFRDS